MQRALEALLIGRALSGRYVLEAVLGRGGMSVVFRGRDETLGRPVAVKLIQHDEASEEERAHLRQRFRREAGAAARIPPHPNVIRIYDYGTDPELDLDFIVMELLEGRDLKQVLDGEPPPQQQALRVLVQAARGIAAGHRAGVVHRDVKPGNILLVGGDPEDVRVLDFGIAKVLESEGDDDLTQFGQVPLSPAYASPEQLAPGGRLSPASDVYQLGLVGYEMLAGERPFSQEERERLGRGERVPLPVRGRWNRVAPPLRSVIERALDPDPRQRYPDAAAFAEALPRGEREDVAPPVTALTSPGRAGEDRTLVTGPAEGTTVFAPPGSDPAPARIPWRGGRIRGWRLPAPAAPAGAILLLIALTWAASQLLDREPSPESSVAPELTETFQRLESEASRTLERAGAWER